MLILTDKGSWVVNGGSGGSAITPAAIVANPQSFVGANDVPPIVANYDILYIQSKGSGFETLRIISILTYSQAPIYQCFHLSFSADIIS